VTSTLDAIRERIVFDDAVEDIRGDLDEDYAGWYAIRTAPFACPAQGCSFVALFQTGAHLVIVWPRIDDPKLLAAASNCQLAGRDPRVVAYEQAFGPAIAYDEWRRLGGPVHGRIPEPDGWDASARDRL
jgi:hypothetical protein